jgi:distribution and morphology protein 31
LYLPLQIAYDYNVITFFSRFSLLMTPHPEYVARGISDYLTSETGVTIIFESAIVPKWKDSKISFKNVYISRRPNSSPSSIPLIKRRSAHTAALGYDVSNHPAYHHIGGEEDELADKELIAAEEDFNYSMFDLTVDSIDVTLSLWRWLDGRGLVESAVVKGVRGVLGKLFMTASFRC